MATDKVPDFTGVTLTPEQASRVTALSQEYTKVVQKINNSSESKIKGLKREDTQKSRKEDGEKARARKHEILEEHPPPPPPPT